MKRILKISAEDLKHLREILFRDLPKESAAFLLAGKSSLPDQELLLVRRIVEIPRSEYVVQESYRLEVSTRAINGLIALCERNGLGVVICHSHPGPGPYSASDDFGEQRIAEAIWQFLPRVPVWSLLLYQESLQGRVWLPGPTRKAHLEEIIVMGRALWRYNLVPTTNASMEIDLETHDRQVAALGREGQSKITSSKVGIVGLGGTGSPSAEQLVRLGVRNLVLIDKDVFSPSNKSRLYGSFAEHAKQSLSRFRPKPISKVDLVAKHLRRIEPQVRLKTYASNVVVEDVCKALLDRDVIFLCTDEHWGRSVVNQVAYQYMIPVINMGIRIDSDKGKITEAIGAVHLLRPNKPCLWCYQYLRSEQVRAESLPEHERKSLQREGYVQGLTDRAPSLIPFTTWVSSISTSLFLQLITDYMGESGDIARINIFLTDGTTRRGTCQIADGCICTKVKGFGDYRPLPTIESWGARDV